MLPRRSISRLGLLLGMIATTILAGCGNKAPTGQVVAKVNGEDVTRRDLAIELGSSGVRQNVDLKTVQPQLVERVLMRKLAVEEAKREGIDKTPEYQAAELRAREMLLANQLVDQWTAKLPPPSDAEAREFIAANPQMFDDRAILTVDQIRTSSIGLDAKALAPFTSNDQIVAYLNSKRHPFERGQAALDTLALPKKAVDQIMALPPGMPFMFTQDTTVILSVVIGRRPAPVPEAERIKVAKASMGQENAKKAVESQLNSLRASAQIEYQPGFAPSGKTKKP